MSTKLYVESLWDELVVAWNLFEQINELPESDRSELEKVWFHCVKDHPCVDVELTRAQSHHNISALGIFCTNSYGAHFNEEMSAWVPFRHRPIDLERLNVS